MQTEGRSERRSGRQQRYEEYITRRSKAAEVTGRREPYHLTYIKARGGARQQGSAERGQK